MATYKEIANKVKDMENFTPKSCWIAHVLSDHGLTKRPAHNRSSPTKRKHPCPHNKRLAIENALRCLKMIT